MHVPCVMWWTDIPIHTQTLRQPINKHLTGRPGGLLSSNGWLPSNATSNATKTGGQLPRGPNFSSLVAKYVQDKKGIYCWERQTSSAGRRNSMRVDEREEKAEVFWRQKSRRVRQWGGCTQFLHDRSWMAPSHPYVRCRHGARRVFTNEAVGRAGKKSSTITVMGNKKRKDHIREWMYVPKRRWLELDPTITQREQSMTARLPCTNTNERNLTTSYDTYILHVRLHIDFTCVLLVYSIVVGGKT